MHVICQKQLLSEAVMNVGRAVPSKSSLPALEGIHLKTLDGALQLSGYDMEMGITTSIKAEIQTAGEIVLSARLFSDMLRKLSGDTISIECDEKYLTKIICGMTEFTILGTPADEFPELPAVGDGSPLSIPQDKLKSMIDQTLFAISTSNDKPIHMGSLFNWEQNLLTVVSVDGYRLALRKEPVEGDLDISFVVPGKTLSEIGKLLDEEDEDPARLTVSKKHMVCDIGPYSIITRLLEGEFLDYNASIPKDNTTSVVVSTRELIDSVERTSLLISDRLRSPLRVTFEENLIKLSCSTAIGKAYDELGCSLTGQKVEMGFNNKYLLDALKASGSDQVKLELNGPLSPIKVVPMEGDDFLFLVLPVRLKNEV
ncbi:DNA polymerase III subunit beta [Oscillospiraceae bacterium MB08-C2-2]|nr:DNA polymerase III subunit beta [Oscillospiraceae bacterium MB08-C2-2]